MTATVAGTIRWDRSRFIGGSDIGAIIGVSRFKTALDVWREKIGEAPPSVDTPDTLRGTKLEDIAAAEFAEKMGVRLRRVNTAIRHTKHEFLLGHVDRRYVGIRTLVELKCPRLGAFYKIKREGLDQDRISQMQWYLGLDGTNTGYWGLFCADAWEILCPPVNLDIELYNSMVERAVHFWHEHVLTKKPPTDKQSAELALEIAQVAPENTVRRDDPEFGDAMRLFREAKALSAEAETIEAQAKERVRDLIGSKPGLYLAPGMRLSYTMAQGRSSFDKKALANSRPLDRLKVGAKLQELWMKLAPSPTTFGLEDVIQAIGHDCDVDLATFESRGPSYPIMKPAFFEEG